VKHFNEFGKSTISLTRFFAKANKIVNDLRAEANQLQKGKAEELEKKQAEENSRKRSALREVDPPAALDTRVSKTQKIQKAQGYLGLVKDSLGPEKFAQFQQSLRKYKAKDITIQRVMQDCLPLFLAISDPDDRQEVLKGFEGFVPSKYKEDFQHMVKMGSLTPSNVLKDKTKVKAMPREDVKAEMEKMIQSRAATKAAEMIKLEASETKSNNNNNNNHNNNNNTNAAEPIVISSGSPAVVVVPTEAPVKKAPMVVAAPVIEESAQAHPKCPICLDALRQPFSANCGHVCCFLCWQKWLGQKLECPVCKEKVRVKHLRKLYWN
jgi:hypothetical protein